MEKLDHTEVRRIEAVIDKHFTEADIPHADAGLSRLAVCTAMESEAVEWILATAETWRTTPDCRSDLVRLTTYLDKGKFALREALYRCGQIQEDSFTKSVLTAEVMQKATDLVEASWEFADAKRIFAQVYEGSSCLKSDPERTKYVFPATTGQRQYWSLMPLLGADDQETDNVFGELLPLFCGETFRIEGRGASASWKPMISRIVAGVRERRGRLRYQFVTNHARDLLPGVTARKTVLPDQWQFPGFSSADAHRYFDSLRAVAMYHLLSACFGARREENVQDRAWQVCLLIEAEALNELICRISGLPSTTVSTISKMLTYGVQTTYPDPALQPLIETRKGSVVIPCIMLLTCNWPRNLLALHARSHKDDFDRKSHVFEQAMIEKCKLGLPTEYKAHFSIYLPSSGKDEEIDLLLVDEVTKTLLIVELGWMLPPGDMREIQHREKRTAEKRKQAARKAEGTKARIAEVISKFGLTGSAWSTKSILVVEGFRGSASDQHPEVPVVPLPVFLVATNRAPNLLALHNVLCSDAWLPRKDIDFKEEYVEQTFGGLVFSTSGFSLMDREYLTDTLEHYLTEAFSEKD